MTLQYEMIMLKATLMTAEVAVREESWKTIISSRQFLASRKINSRSADLHHLKLFVVFLKTLKDG